jgi:hypothetical protein
MAALSGLEVFLRQPPPVVRGQRLGLVTNPAAVDRDLRLAIDRVVAAGRPAELSRPRGVEIETDDGLQTFPDALREDAPRLVAELVAGGARVYGVRVLATTLEETYLEAVEDAS